MSDWRDDLDKLFEDIDRAAPVDDQVEQDVKRKEPGKRLNSNIPVDIKTVDGERLPVYSFIKDDG